MTARQVPNLDQPRLGDGGDDELGDAVAPGDVDRFGRIQVHEHDPDLAAVAGIDHARPIRDAQPATQGQAAACVNEGGEARRQRDRDAGRHEQARAGGEDRVMSGAQIESGIPRMLIGRQREVRVESMDEDVGHAGERTGQRSPCDDRLVPAPDVLFQERLIPRWPAWVFCGGLIIMIAGAYGAALGARTGWLLGIGLAVAAVIGTLWLSPVIRVTADALQAGAAALPRAAVGSVEVLDRDAAASARGPQADARAFVLLRSLHAGTAVRVHLDDPADPHPIWLLTTARPDELARALSS